LYILSASVLGGVAKQPVLHQTRLSTSHTFPELRLSQVKAQKFKKPNFLLDNRRYDALKFQYDAIQFKTLYHSEFQVYFFIRIQYVVKACNFEYFSQMPAWRILKTLGRPNIH
jgi:hypothetical protein